MLVPFSRPPAQQMPTTPLGCQRRATPPERRATPPAPLAEWSAKGVQPLQLHRATPPAPLAPPLAHPGLEAARRAGATAGRRGLFVVARSSRGGCEEVGEAGRNEWLGGESGGEKRGGVHV